MNMHNLVRLLIVSVCVYRSPTVAGNEIFKDQSRLISKQIMNYAFTTLNSGIITALKMMQTPAKY